MAVTTNLSVFDAADSNANWSELTGHLSGSAPAATTENYWQNGTAVDQATGQTTGQTSGMQCDFGANVSWTSSSNWVFLTWTKFDAGTNITSWSTGGMRIGVGTTSGNMDYYNAMGGDFGSYPSGGWQSTAIDPEYSGNDGIEGSGKTSGQYRLIGFNPNMVAKITKGSPTVADIIRYGRGDVVVTGTETFSSIATADNTSTVRWGLFYPSGGGYLWKGLLSLGTAGTSVSLTDSNKNIRVDDTPRVTAGFNKIEIRNASSSVSWDTVNISGVQTSITGSAPVSPGDFEVVDNATVSLTGCTFTDMGTFVLKAATAATDCTFRRCHTVTANGADLSGSSFINCETGTSVLWNTDSDTDGKLDGCSFTSDGSNYGLEITALNTVTSITLRNVDFSSYTTGTNSALYVNIASGSFTINLVGCTGTINYATAGATVTLVQDPVTTKVIVKDASVNPPATITDQSVNVYLTAAAGGPLTEGTQIIKGFTNTSGEITDLRSWASNQPVTGWARRASASAGALPSGTTYFKSGSIAGDVNSTSGATFTVLLQPDE